MRDSTSVFMFAAGLCGCRGMMPAPPSWVFSIISIISSSCETWVWGVFGANHATFDRPRRGNSPAGLLGDLRHAHSLGGVLLALDRSDTGTLVSTQCHVSGLPIEGCGGVRRRTRLCLSKPCHRPTPRPPADPSSRVHPNRITRKLPPGHPSVAHPDQPPPSPVHTPPDRVSPCVEPAPM